MNPGNTVRGTQRRWAFRVGLTLLNVAIFAFFFGLAKAAQTVMLAASAGFVVGALLIVAGRLSGRSSRSETVSTGRQDAKGTTPDV